MSIEDFVDSPCLHLKNLHEHLKLVAANTPSHHHDHFPIHQVLHGTILINESMKWRLLFEEDAQPWLVKATIKNVYVCTYIYNWWCQKSPAKELKEYHNQSMVHTRLINARCLKQIQNLSLATNDNGTNNERPVVGGDS